jgi:signal transduction histidine kinase
LVITPVVALLLLTREPHNGLQPEQTSAFVAYALVLGSSVYVYFDWRMRTSYGGHDVEARLAGWLTVGLLVTAIQGLVGAAGAPDTIEATTDRLPVVNQLVLVLVLFVLAAVAERIDVPADPALVGAFISLVLTAGYVVAHTLASPLHLSHPAASLLNTAVLLAGLVLALILLHRTQVSLWVRRRLAGAAIVLCVAQCLTNLAYEHLLVMSAVVVANLGGAMVLCALTQTLLRVAVFAQQKEMVSLHASLAEVRAGVQEDQELLHEVGSTLAGIASASRMIQLGAVIEPVRRERLEAMVAAEVARLERLMSRRAPIPALDYAVDAVIEPLVVSHQARGRDVRWEPCGLNAAGAPDDLAEVVNILLENAACHGGGTIELVVRPHGEFVEIACSDSGPGIAPEVRAGLFTSGVRGPESEGHGFGLAIAQRLMSDAGGTLRFDEFSSHGATLIALVPRSEVDRVATSNVA